MVCLLLESCPLYSLITSGTILSEIAMINKNGKEVNLFFSNKLI